MTNNTDSNPTHLVTLPDGRSLALDEAGDPNGAPVVLLSSAPGSRRFDPDVSATTAAGIRLLTVDRPGYGASTPLAEGTAPSWGAFADDLAHALGQIGIERTAVAGWSNGGTAALALAARHPALVSAVAVVGTPAPDDDVPWLPDEHRGLIHSLRADPASAVDTLTPALAELVDNPMLAVGSLSRCPANEHLLEQPTVRAALETMLVEAFRPGAAGLATDIVATNVAPLGFALEEVEVPVHLFYGVDDVIVPPAHGDYYAAKLPDAHLERIADIGHLVIVAAWPAILAAVLTPRG
ncbi:MAG: alpha/beta hydrolase [Chloroflexi bacterium]|nr:alpha/beta hydrolase [Chloroflexota bacterium]MDA1146065.1 alpha/beta hydrolase [Chloroflexota bacterium]